jgi:hypothetical protein
MERLQSPQPQQLAQQQRLVLDPQWLERLPSPQPQQLAPEFQPLRVQYQPLLLCQLLWLRRRKSFQPLRVQYQPSLLSQILMVRYQLLWLRRRQSFQPLRVQYQPLLLCQLLWLRRLQSFQSPPQPQQLAPDQQHLPQQRRLVLDHQ